MVDYNIAREGEPALSPKTWRKFARRFRYFTERLPSDGPVERRLMQSGAVVELDHENRQAWLVYANGERRLLNPHSQLPVEARN